MDNARTTLCASCRKYPLQEAAENGGSALCPDYNTMRAWNDPATVLYQPAKDRENRKRLVIKLMEQLTNKGE